MTKCQTERQPSADDRCVGVVLYLQDILLRELNEQFEIVLQLRESETRALLFSGGLAQ